MSTDRSTSLQRLGLLSTLYFAQGLPFGFFTLAVPVLLRSQGHDLRSVSGSSLLLMPWAFKFVWAPLVDRYGTRRSWILPMQLVNTLILLALGTRDPGDLPALALGMFLVAAASATQDIASDGLAVKLIPDEERGTANSIQVGAYRVGMVVGGGLMPFLYESYGPAGAFGCMAGLVVLSTVPVLLAPEPRGDTAPATIDRAVLAPWFTWAALPWLGTLLLYKAGDAMATPLVKPMLVDAGFSLSQIGAITGLAGSSIAVVASAMGAPVVARLSRPRALLLFGLMQAAAQVSFGWLDPIAVVVVEHFVGTFATIALFTAMMDRCRRPGREGSDYTLQASMVVFFTGLAGAAGGAIADELGYARYFVLCGVVSVAGAVLAATRRADEPPLGA